MSKERHTPKGVWTTEGGTVKIAGLRQPSAPMNQPKAPRHAARVIPIVCGVLSLLGNHRAAGTTYTWNATVDNSWNNAANWAEHQAPPTSGLTSSDIVYNASAYAYPYLPATYSINSLTFNAASNGYDFNAGSLSIGANGITQNSASAETFDIPVSLGARTTWTMAIGGTGALNFNQGLALGNYTLTVNATNNTLRGALTGTGGLTLASGNLTLSGTSTFTGSIQIPSGSLILPLGASVTPSEIDVGFTDAGAVMQNGGAVTVGGTLYLYVSSIYTLNDGTLTTGKTRTTGFSARFVQNGGIHRCGDLVLGQSLLGFGGPSPLADTYVLNNGSLNATNSLSVGYTNPSSSFSQKDGTVTAGTVLLGVESGGIGTYNLDGGTLTSASVQQTSGTGVFNFNGGTLQAPPASASFTFAVGTANVRRGGVIIDTNGSNATVSQVLLHSTISGDAATDGGLVKVGPGTLTLAGANTYNGGTTIKAGTVSVANDSLLGDSSGAVTLFGGTLAYTNSTVTTTGRTFNLGTGTLSPASGGSITYSHATVNGGSLGAGSHNVTDASVLNGTRLTTGTILNLTSGTVSFNNVLLSGNSTLTQTSGTTLNATGDLTANAATTLTLNGTTNVIGGYLSGAMTITSNGQLNEANAAGSTTPLYLDGSRGVTVNSGGRLSAASGSTIELGGLLTNNGAQTGVLNVNLGGIVQGSGTFGTVNLAATSAFSATGTITGNLFVANGATVSLSGSGNRLTVKGGLVNNGTLRFERGAVLALTGGASNLVNNGTIDVITSGGSLPSGFTNNGLVLDSSVVRVKAVARDSASGAVTVSIDGYPGHKYQLQKSASLDGGSFANVAGVAAQSNPATNTAAATFAFTDTNPAAGKGFYRVQVDP